MTDDRQLQQARDWAVALENETARLTAELDKYVGKEPTRDEEMQYLTSCLDAVLDVCDAAEKQATRWEHPLPVPEWVSTVRAAADGGIPKSPWQRAVDGLNALIDADLPVHIEPDGHIANPLGDEHIVWDPKTARWQLIEDAE